MATARVAEAITRVGMARVHTVVVTSKVATPVVVVLSGALLTSVSYRRLRWPAGRWLRRRLRWRLWRPASVLGASCLVSTYVNVVRVKVLTVIPSLDASRVCHASLILYLSSVILCFSHGVYHLYCFRSAHSSTSLSIPSHRVCGSTRRFRPGSSRP